MAYQTDLEARIIELEDTVGALMLKRTVLPVGRPDRPSEGEVWLDPNVGQGRLGLRIGNSDRYIVAHD